MTAHGFLGVLRATRQEAATRRKHRGDAAPVPLNGRDDDRAPQHVPPHDRTTAPHPPRSSKSPVLSRVASPKPRYRTAIQRPSDAAATPHGPTASRGCARQRSPSGAKPSRNTAVRTTAPTTSPGRRRARGGPVRAGAEETRKHAAGRGSDGEPPPAPPPPALEGVAPPRSRHASPEAVLVMALAIARLKGPLHRFLPSVRPLTKAKGSSRWAMSPL